MDDELREIFESDRDLIHDAAREGVTMTGEQLPREVDDDGRVFAVCGCGKRFPLEDREGGLSSR